MNNFHGTSVDSVLFSIKENGALLHWLHAIYATVDQDVFIHLFDKQNRSGVASDYDSTVAGTVLVTVNDGKGLGHGLGDAGAEVAVQCISTNYAGEQDVTIVDQWSFYFTDTYVATDTVLFYFGAITLGTTVPIATIKVPGVVAGKNDGYDGNPDVIFEQGIIAGVTTTVNGSAGVPTTDVDVSASFIGRPLS